MKLTFYVNILYELLSNIIYLTKCNLLYMRFYQNHPFLTKIFQKSCIVLYNSCFSIFAYLERLSKIYRKAIFRHFLSFFELSNQEFDSVRYFMDQSLLDYSICLRSFVSIDPWIYSNQWSLCLPQHLSRCFLIRYVSSFPSIRWLFELHWCFL